MEVLRQAVTLLELVAWVRRLAVLCHGQAGKVRVELVERCLRLRVRGRPMAVRCRLEAGKVRVELVERCLRLRVRGRHLEARVS